MYEDLTPEEKAEIAEFDRRQHEERMRDPEFRKGWERMRALFDAKAEVERLRKELDYLASDARLVAAEAAIARVREAVMNQSSTTSLTEAILAALPTPAPPKGDTP